MSQQKAEIFGPVALTNVAANLIAPAAAGAGGVGYTPTADRLTVKHMKVTNKTAAAHQVSLYKGATGATAAGTEICFQKNVPANDYIDLYGPWVLEGANGFIVGLADANTSLTFEADGEVGKV
jgi:hypothetical protein